MELTPEEKREVLKQRICRLKALADKKGRFIGWEYEISPNKLADFLIELSEKQK